MDRVRCLHSAIAAALLAAGAAVPAGAQTGPPTPDTPRSQTCEDSVGIHSADTVDVYVVALLRPFDPSQAVPRMVLDLVLYEIASRFRAPAPLALHAYGGVEDIRKPADSVDGGHLVVSAMYRLALRRDARVSDARVITSSLNAELDRRILDAIREADSARVMPQLPESVRGKSAELRLLLSTRSSPPRDSGMALFRLRTPRVRFSRIVRPLNNSMRVPGYPIPLRNAGVEGEVLTQFVVTRQGNVDPRTISIIRATHVQFVEAVLEVVPAFRFEPARVAGCPVAQLVQMPFAFRFSY
ncbi:MAG: energy transducer TonB [Gemmatimonadaceae bacterium]